MGVIAYAQDKLLIHGSRSHYLLYLSKHCYYIDCWVVVNVYGGIQHCPLVNVTGYYIRLNGVIFGNELQV